MSSFIGPTSVVFIHGIRLGRGRRRSRRRRQIRMTIAVGLLHLHVNGWRPSNEIFRMRMGGGALFSSLSIRLHREQQQLKSKQLFRKLAILSAASHSYFDARQQRDATTETSGSHFNRCCRLLALSSPPPKKKKFLNELIS